LHCVHKAARRSGINVDRIYTNAFVLCGMFAATVGVLAAARLASASQQAGTGDVNLNAIAAAVIGGTSLFGAAGHSRNRLDRQWAHVARSVVVASLHDHPRSARHRRGRRLIGAPLAGLSRPRLISTI
jgi:predicted ABC-type sugar transport system permease subunit